MDGGKPNDAQRAGYISWSPKEQFDNAPANCRHGVRCGSGSTETWQKVSRAGWNGKGMWLAMIAGDGWGIRPRLTTLQAHHITHAPFIGMKTADNKFVPLACQPNRRSGR